MKSSVFPRLYKSSAEYRNARKKRDDALYVCNIETFEYIIDDYERKNWVMPTEWMTQGCSHHH